MYTLQTPARRFAKHVRKQWIMRRNNLSSNMNRQQNKSRRQRNWRWGIRNIVFSLHLLLAPVVKLTFRVICARHLMKLKFHCGNWKTNLWLFFFFFLRNTQRNIHRANITKKKNVDSKCCAENQRWACMQQYLDFSRRDNRCLEKGGWEEQAEDAQTSRREAGRGDYWSAFFRYPLCLLPPPPNHHGAKQGETSAAA